LESTRNSIKPLGNRPDVEDLRLEESTFMSNLGAKRQKRTEEEVQAAGVIQRLARGWLLRRWLKRNSGRLRLRRKLKRSYQVISQQIKVKLDMDEFAKKEEEKRECAIIKMQACLRGRLARRAFRKAKMVRKFERLNEAATKIGIQAKIYLSKAAKICLWTRLDSEGLLRAAIHLQSTFRMWYYGKRVVYKVMVRRERQSSILLQCFWRKVVATIYRTLEQTRFDNLRHNQSASNIQRLARGALCRKQFQWIRDTHTRELREKNSLFIQRIIRRWLHGKCRVSAIRWMKQRKERVFGAIHLQRVARGFFARKRRTHLLADRVTDIFFYTMVGNKVMVEDLHAVSSCNKRFDIRGDSVFTIACKFGHKKIVRKCLKWGLDMNYKNDEGQTGVMLATMQGHAEMAEFLVTNKADVSIVVNNKNLLHWACEMGMEGVTMALVHRGMSVIEPCASQSNRLPLHFAVSKRFNVEVLKLLLKQNLVDVHCQDDLGNTALHIAASNGHDDAVRMLIDDGAGIECANSEGYSPWRCALNHSQKNCVVMLRGGWQSITTSTNMFVEAPETLMGLCAGIGDEAADLVAEAISQGFDVNYHEIKNGMTLPMVAASAGASCVVGLFKKQALENVDNQNRNVFHFATPGCFEQIFNHYGNLSLLTAGDNNKVTPLHLACKNMSVFPKNLRRMMDAAKINLRDYCDFENKTVLHYAAYECSLSVLDELLDYEPYLLYANDANGASALHYLVSNPENNIRGKRCVERLKDLYDATDGHGALPLHAASLSGCYELVEVLASAMPGAMLTQDDNSETPLHYAVKRNNFECLRYFIAQTKVDELMLGELLILSATLGHSECFIEIFTEEAVGKLSSLGSIMKAIVQYSRIDMLNAVLEIAPMDAVNDHQLIEIAASSGNRNILKKLVDHCSKHELSFQLDMEVIALSVAKSTTADSVEMLEDVMQVFKHDYEIDPAMIFGTAAGSGNINCCKWIFQHHPDVLDKQNDKQRTALHYACANDELKTAKWLMECGAKQELEDEEGNTAIQLAGDRILQYLAN